MKQATQLLDPGLLGYLGKRPFFSYSRIPRHESGVEVQAIFTPVKNLGHKEDLPENN